MAESIPDSERDSRAIANAEMTSPWRNDEGIVTTKKRMASRGIVNFNLGAIFGMVAMLAVRWMAPDQNAPTQTFRPCEDAQRAPSSLVVPAVTSPNDSPIIRTTFPKP